MLWVIRSTTVDENVNSGGVSFIGIGGYPGLGHLIYTLVMQHGRNEALLAMGTKLSSNESKRP